MNHLRHDAPTVIILTKKRRAVQEALESDEGVELVDIIPKTTLSPLRKTS